MVTTLPETPKSAQGATRDKPSTLALGEEGQVGSVGQSDFSPAPEFWASEAGARLCWRAKTPRPPFSHLSDLPSLYPTFLSSPCCWPGPLTHKLPTRRCSVLYVIFPPEPADFYSLGGSPCSPRDPIFPGFLRCFRNKWSPCFPLAVYILIDSFLSCSPYNLHLT